MRMPANPQDASQGARELVGQTLADRFRLDAVLGLGAMGVVYRAHHLGLQKDVALKLLHRELTANEQMVARFDREAAAASRLDHPNCVRVMDFGSTKDGRRFLVMEYLEGEDLAAIAQGAMPPFRVVNLTLQILAGLEHAHQHGLVHRDIKPENIFVVGTGDGEQVKLLDFGIAKVSYGAGSSQLTQAGMIFGTPHFMSPEQARGTKIDARSDLYSLGVVIYALLSGTLPFEGDDPVAILRHHIRDAPPPLSDAIPGSLRHFVHRLLAKDPADRFADATTAIAALRRAAAPTDPVAVAPPTPGAAVERQPSAPVAVAGGGTMRVQADAVATPAVADPAERGPASRPPWLVPAIGVAAIGVIALLVAWPSGQTDAPREDAAPRASDRGDTQHTAPADQAHPDPASASADSDSDAADAEAPSSTPSAEELSRRTLRANLASIDTLIESKNFSAARITIGPLLEVLPAEAGLHWRMGKVLHATDPRKNTAAALESFQTALKLDAALIDDASFSAELWSLIDDPSVRVQAAEVAVEQLGSDAFDRLVSWVNVQKQPLPYPTRHTVVGHLRQGGQGKRINEPLQVALDLWQASGAADPCAAFVAAIAAAKEKPDSFLMGSLVAAPTPKNAEGVECTGVAETLVGLRSTYAERYAGLDPVVPSAFRPARPKPAQNNRRRRR